MELSTKNTSDASNASQKAAANRGWHRTSEGETVIVFVHGLLSSSKQCWTAENGLFWPELVCSDASFLGAGVYLGGYHTKIDSGKYDIAQCSREIMDGLRFDKVKNRAPLDHQRIVFLVHSLGGIIIRRLLEENSNEFSNKRIGLVMMASPSLGSSYADILAPLSKLYGNKIGQQLKTDDALLLDIDHRFRALLDSKKIADISGAEACEHHGLLRFKFLPFRMRPIVTQESSSRYFGSPKIIAETDHSTIAKPTSPDHGSHEFFRNFYSLKFGPEKIKNTPFTPHSTTSHILFDVYSEQTEPYCLTRDIDAKIFSCLQIKSVWLTGRSGSGKTTAIKRYLHRSAMHPFELTLGHVEGQINGARLTSELIQTINIRDQTNRPETFANVVDALLVARTKQRAVLFLDEIPIASLSSSDLQALLQYLSSLIEETKKRSGPDVQFIICSIDPPLNEALSRKFREQVHLLDIETWSKAELNSLAEIINLALPQLRPHPTLQEKIISSCNGTPRLLKAFYKRLLIANSEIEHPEESLRTVLVDFPAENSK